MAGGAEFSEAPACVLVCSLQVINAAPIMMNTTPAQRKALICSCRNRVPPGW